MARAESPRENPGGSDKSNASRGQSNNWSNDEVKALIALWSEADIQNALDDPHTRNAKIYGRISKQPADLEYNRSHECQQKNKGHDAQVQGYSGQQLMKWP